MDASRTNKLWLDFVVEFVFHPHAVAFLERFVLCFPVVRCGVSLALFIGVFVGLLVDIENRTQHLAEKFAAVDIFWRV